MPDAWCPKEEYLVNSGNREGAALLSPAVAAVTNATFPSKRFIFATASKKR
jgi:hypothetical protein